MTEYYSVTWSNFYKSPKQPHGKLERNRVSSPGDTSFRIGLENLGQQRSESPIQTGIFFASCDQEEGTLWSHPLHRDAFITAYNKSRKWHRQIRIMYSSFSSSSHMMRWRHNWRLLRHNVEVFWGILNFIIFLLKEAGERRRLNQTKSRSWPTHL